jgi:acetate kinase
VTTRRAVLAINAGSSTVKCALFSFEPQPHSMARETLEAAGSSRAPAVLAWLNEHTTEASIAAIGHRIVHGGPRYHDPQRITPAVLAELGRLTPFAPNHLPDEIALIEACGRALPDVPQVACFDTAFHTGMPDVARRLPVPGAYEEEGVRRYGFHGLSYAYLVEELGRLTGYPVGNGRVILAHLGNGSSLAAVRGGHSIDTSMSFTPIGGVIMSTRSGDLDPGLVTYIARTGKLTPDQVEDLLSQRSGLLGISGSTADMRTLLDCAPSDPACRLAVAMYCYQIRKCIGAFAAALEGLDTLVFSGGIGEHASAVREEICDGLEFLGVRLDADRNAHDAPVISRADARVIVRVIPTDEEVVIARAAWQVLV